MVFIATVGCLVSACGGGGGSDDDGGAAATPPTSNASASLSWNVPDNRVGGDNLDLTDIGGYEIQYRKQGDGLFESVLVDDANVTEFELTNLEQGVYEFKVSVYDSEGLYSDFSNVIVATLPYES